MVADPAPRVPVSSIIETHSPEAVEELHAMVQSELDMMESMLDAAHAKRRLGDAFEWESTNQQPPDFALSAQPDASWSEIAEYEAVRDERHAMYLAARSKPRTAVCAWPGIPGPASFGMGAHNVAGVLNSVSGNTAIHGVHSRILRADRHGPDLCDVDPAASALSLAYFSIRNGYHGGQGGLIYNTTPATFSHTVLQSGSRVNAPALLLSFSITLPLAAPLCAGHQQTDRSIGDVV
ncbi:MAG: hypothetical protein RIF32_15570 [Leptospirales bacterium]